jgi:hypothetical protein
MRWDLRGAWSPLLYLTLQGEHVDEKLAQHRAEFVLLPARDATVPGHYEYAAIGPEPLPGVIYDPSEVYAFRTPLTLQWVVIRLRVWRVGENGYRQLALNRDTGRWRVDYCDAYGLRIGDLRRLASLFLNKLRVGNPGTSRTFPGGRDEAERRIREAMHEVREQGREKVSYESVAVVLKIGTRTLKENVDLFQLDWQKLKSE